MRLATNTRSLPPTTPPTFTPDELEIVYAALFSHELRAAQSMADSRALIAECPELANAESFRREFARLRDQIDVCRAARETVRRMEVRG